MNESEPGLPEVVLTKEQEEMLWNILLHEGPPPVEAWAH
jgi:hypothetical protein